jgi:hypothetical protein
MIVVPPFDDGDEVTADPDDGDAGHVSGTYITALDGEPVAIPFWSWRT